MKIEFVGKNYDIGKKLEEKIKEKIDKMECYFDKSAKARVVCKVENKTFKMEVTISQKSGIYRAEVVGENMYENIDLALPKIERQAVRYMRRKIDNKKREGKKEKEKLSQYIYITEEPAALPEVFKRKTYKLEKLTELEAKESIERVDNDFYIYIDAVSGKVNVMYKRKEGGFGVIETK